MGVLKMISFLKVIGSVFYYIFKFSIGLLFDLLLASDKSAKSAGSSDGLGGRYIGDKHVTKQEADIIASRGDDYWQHY